MTTDLLTFPSGLLESDSLYEVIDGIIVETPTMGNRQVLLTNFLHLKLGNHSENLGHCVVEMLFDFTTQLGRKRRPDLAFVSYERWPREMALPDVDGWPVVPNLAVEVISRTNGWDEILEKIDEYFQVGVQRVWVISLYRKLIHVYESPTQIKVLTAADELSDERMLPGFKFSISELFASVGMMPEKV